MVYTGKHQIGPLLQQRKQRQLHTIAGGAAAGPGGNPRGKQLIRPLGPQGSLQGEAMAGGGTLLIGANHHDLMASPRRLCCQGADAIGKHAVVVADQDPQGLGLAVRRLEAAFLKSLATGTQP